MILCARLHSAETLIKQLQVSQIIQKRNSKNSKKLTLTDKSSYDSNKSAENNNNNNNNKEKQSHKYNELYHQFQEVVAQKNEIIAENHKLKEELDMIKSQLDKTSIEHTKAQQQLCVVIYCVCVWGVRCVCVTVCGYQ